MQGEFGFPMFRHLPAGGTRFVGSACQVSQEGGTNPV